jgi:prepilin-type N-terminal cleavage/methylation domain-containing protein
MHFATRARLSRCARVRVTAEDGFTLIELLVSMVILLVVIASLASVLVSATHTAVDANNRFQAQEQARTGLTFLTRELHCASTVAVTNTSGTTLAAGTAGAGITETIPSTCATSGGSTLYVTWCTAASTLKTGDYALYRRTSTASQPTCTSSGQVKWVDYLQTSTPFCLPSTTAACSGVLRPASSLPLLHVTMPVNLKGPTATTDTYNVVDDVALRNGAHS